MAGTGVLLEMSTFQGVYWFVGVIYVVFHSPAGVGLLWLPKGHREVNRGRWESSFSDKNDKKKAIIDRSILNG